jgi:hypothetical protein
VAPASTSAARFTAAVPAERRKLRLIKSVSWHSACVALTYQPAD